MKRIGHKAALGIFVVFAAGLSGGLAGAQEDEEGAEADPGNPTCMVAMAETAFERASPEAGSATDACCLVLSERSWYSANDVHVGRHYLVNGELRMRATNCAQGDGEAPVSLVVEED